jgi:ferrochelatase
VGDLAATGRADGVLVCPQGFTADHLEVLYDLDVVTAAAAADAGLAFGRTRSLNDDATVLGALARRVAAAA